MSIFPTESSFSTTPAARAARQVDDQRPVTKFMQNAATQQTAQDLSKPPVPAVTPAVRVDPSTNIPVLEVYRGSEVVFRAPTERELRAYRNGEKPQDAPEEETAKPEASAQAGDGISGFQHIIAKSQVD